MPMSRFVVDRLAQRWNECELACIVARNAILVPVPSSGLIQPGSLWVPLLIAREMVRVGLARRVEPVVERRSAVRKSAFAPPSQRVTAREHYDSLVVRRLAFPDEHFVVVDDVLTRGATLLAAASRVQESWPTAQVTGFAILRTISDPDAFERMFAPCTGRIDLLDDGSTRRRP